MKKISELLDWMRDELTGIEEVTNLLPDFDAIIREVKKRENTTQSDVCDKLQSEITDTGLAYNPYDKGWNAALRFAIAEIELSDNPQQPEASRDL